MRGVHPDLGSSGLALGGCDTETRNQNLKGMEYIKHPLDRSFAGLQISNPPAKSVRQQTSSKPNQAQQFFVMRPLLLSAMGVFLFS